MPRVEVVDTKVFGDSNNLIGRLTIKVYLRIFSFIIPVVPIVRRLYPELAKISVYFAVIVSRL